MNETIEIIDDMSNPRIKSKLVAQVYALQGVWRIDAKRYRPRRSDRQNRWYWPAFVKPFANYLREQGNDITDDDAHEILKQKFLTVKIVDKITGQIFEFVRSTTLLETVEFNDYLDKIAQMLAEECHYAVPEPSIYREAI